MEAPISFGRILLEVICNGVHCSVLQFQVYFIQANVILSPANATI